MLKKLIEFIKDKQILEWTVAWAFMLGFYTYVYLAFAPLFERAV